MAWGRGGEDARDLDPRASASPSRAGGPLGPSQGSRARGVAPPSPARASRPAETCKPDLPQRQGPRVLGVLSSELRRIIPQIPPEGLGTRAGQVARHLPPAALVRGVCRGALAVRGGNSSLPLPPPLPSTQCHPGGRGDMLSLTEDPCKESGMGAVRARPPTALGDVYQGYRAHCWCHQPLAWAGGATLGPRTVPALRLPHHPGPRAPASWGDCGPLAELAPRGGSEGRRPVGDPRHPLRGPTPSTTREGPSRPWGAVLRVLHPRHGCRLVRGVPAHGWAPGPLVGAVHRGEPTGGVGAGSLGGDLEPGGYSGSLENSQDPRGPAGPEKCLPKTPQDP